MYIDMINNFFLPELGWKRFSIPCVQHFSRMEWQSTEYSINGHYLFPHFSSSHFQTVCRHLLASLVLELAVYNYFLSVIPRHVSTSMMQLYLKKCKILFPWYLQKSIERSLQEFISNSKTAFKNERVASDTV